MEIIIENNVNELKLIKKWKRKHDENIVMYFFNKYKDDFVNITYSKINRKFSSVPIEKGDLFYLVWKTIKSCLQSFDENRSKNFKSYILQNLYSLTIKEALKFLNNKHIVLNTAYSYDKLEDEFPNYNFGQNNKCGIVTSYDQARKNFIDRVVELNKSYDIEFLKRVIYLKSLGYTIEEIAKNLKIKKYEVKKAVDYIVLIAKKLYE